MQTVQTVNFGGPEVLTTVEAPEPSAAPGELVVKVEYAEVLFLDTQLRNGWGAEFFAMEPQFTPGTGVAGTVIGVGEGVDTAAWTGRRVIARTGNFGAYAEQVAVHVDETFMVPASVDLRPAVAALHDGPTALSRLELASIRPGETVLVTAAAGGLGAWLLPLARKAGAHVIAAAGGVEKTKLALEYGAQSAVDYTRSTWLDEARDSAPAGLDVVFDGAGGEIGTAAFAMAAPGARLFGHGAASGDFAGIDPEVVVERELTIIPVTHAISDPDRRRLTREALVLIAAREVTPTIGQVVPLGRAAEAHAAIQARSVAGKTLLAVGRRS